MNLKDILFLDIETISEKRSYKELSDRKRNLFFKKFDYQYQQHIAQVMRELDLNFEDTMNQMVANSEDPWQQVWERNACVNAEFGKILSISQGKFANTDDEGGGSSLKLYLKSITTRSEGALLTEFEGDIKKAKPQQLCAYNGIEFDFQFIGQRMYINGMEPFELINVFNKKPWVVTDNLFDPMRMWKGTATKHTCSLDLMCECLGIESPKGDIDGSMINELFYGMFDKLDKSQLPFDKEEEIFKAIGSYGRKDVLSLAKVFCKLSGLSFSFEPSKIINVE